MSLRDEETAEQRVTFATHLHVRHESMLVFLKNDLRIRDRSFTERVLRLALCSGSLRSRLARAALR